jgi:hypothetical protein
MEGPQLGRQPKQAVVKKIQTIMGHASDAGRLQAHYIRQLFLSVPRPSPPPHYIRRPPVTDEYNGIKICQSYVHQQHRVTDKCKLCLSVL